MTTMSAMNGGPAAFRLSGDRMMAAAASGRLDTEALAAAAAFRTIAAWTLAPAPRDPRAHVWAAHAEARPYLTRLTRHAADHEVASMMTADLFRRLTRRPAAGRLLEARLQEARDHEGDTSVVYVNLYGVFYTPETAAREAVALERGLVEERRAEAAR